MKREAGNIKLKITLAAVLVGIILGCMTFFFVSAVQKQLWQQSIGTILESTQQGCSTLRVQLQEEFKVMNTVAGYIDQFTADQSSELEQFVGGYSQVDSGISLYLEDGSCYPAEAREDEKAAEALAETGQNSGIIDPHISSVTGANVFNLYTHVTLQDGTEGFLLKEYEVESIVDSFTLSFYNDSGFSYVVDSGGNVLIRPPHPKSNKTVQNLFDMLSEGENDQASLGQFKQSLLEARTGWATFTYQGEDTVFCYIPLKLQSDWYLISIIPKSVVSAQTNQIVLRTLTLIAAIILGITLLVALYFRYISRTNRKLRSQADYISHLYNAVPEGIALVTVERPYQFLQLNQEGMRLLGCGENALLGILKEKYLEEIVFPEDYEALAEIFRDTAAGKHKNTFENLILKADGSSFWAAGLVEKTLDEDGRPILIMMFHDITAEKLAEEEEEREKLQERMMLVGAVSNVYPVIISLNLSQDTLKFIYTQPGLLVKMGEQETYSELYQDFIPTVHPDNLEEFKRRFEPGYLLRTLGRERNEIFMELRQMLKDGRYHWTSTQIISVENPYSEDKLAILISRRIDEQRYEEEQQRHALESALENAKAASLAKSRFLSNMSHDIRTPMNAIVGMTAIAAAHLDERERTMECLKKIGLSSQHLLSLINDILDMSKIESGKLSLREEPFNLAELVSDVTELVRTQADAGQLRMKLHLAVLKNEAVIGDPLRIRQVCLNILSNAVKYTLPGGNINIELEQEAARQPGYESYVFRCTDSGIGMSEEFLDKLFQPFERAQDSTSSKTVGTGLGMAITKNIVDLMGGVIHVDSKLGEGSAVTVVMPLRVQDVQPEEVPGEWEGVRSLIVDDDRQSCESAAILLEDMGLRAHFVTEAETAVSRIVEAKDSPDPYELVIMDWKMPDMNGVEATRRIRHEVGDEVPVIILTAYDWTEIENEAREAGVTAFLSKPFYRSKICYLLNELSGEKKEGKQIVFSDKKDYTGRRVLLVEDNAMNREIAHELIGEMGPEVEEAFDGAEAVRKMSDSEEGYYDLIFMDIQMPVMDGYEAAKAIRRLKRTDAGKIPIIAMTANAFEEDVRAALHAGMDAHFAKPIDIEELKKLLDQYLKSCDRKKA
ncbi:response regulator [Qiania dongpingensis]|uniref:Circadian input-output histidine kinase CikA n=1 Tax=Qiania dongpingensis TaxID=2763669 RepID=A0A7G9G1X8_9FIRM|nr:response regulator [Qiania dongpingensis]QNM04810.1 response regulator [Qiania dongpingensis]